MIGVPNSRAMALPRPVVEPPPTATYPSAPAAVATSRASVGGFDGHVHFGFGVDAGAELAQLIGDLLGQILLEGGGEDQDTLEAEVDDFVGQL